MLHIIKHPRRWLALCILTVLFAVLLISTILTEPAAHRAPTYPPADLTATLNKPLLSEADYSLLFAQAGLGRAAVDELLSTSGGRQTILDCQRCFFAPIQYICTPNSPISREESVINDRGQYASATILAPLHDGDILITSASHTFGWRNGHAALVVDASAGSTLESVVLGQNSSLQSVSKWTAYPNFLLLRPKNIAQEDCAHIAQWAYSHLLDVPYDFTVGLLSRKSPASEITGTHCAHLVWAAYDHFGCDLDSNGGAIVTPRDLAASPLLEVVQYYGIRLQARQ